jgi:hypothetical protein
MKYNGISNLKQPGNRQGNMASNKANFGVEISTEKMQRVTKNNPCSVCGKPDWCLYAEDGSAAICQRIQKNSLKRCGDAGWLHVLRDRPQSQRYSPHRKFTVPQDNTPVKDFRALQQQYSRQINGEQLKYLSQQLCVSEASLERLNVGFDGEAFTFPMSNTQGQIVGIRRRFGDGNKRAVTGSKTGLFIATELKKSGTLLITEGPTDCAAALDLGFNAIGRPNCNSKVDMTARFAKGRAIVIIGDNDPPKEDGSRPGKEGAENLAEKLLLHCLSVKIVYPPGNTKDLRQWLRAGLTSGQLQHVIDNTGHLTMELT